MNMGTRRLSAGALAARRLIVHAQEGVSRKSLLEAAAAASRGLQLRPALRLVLEKMTTCYGEQDLARGLMVWPSNTWLVEATGLAERTVRAAIGELVTLRLIEPVDSANRKRYARRDRSGVIVEAFGFNLTPLYVRRHELQGLVVERQELERLRARKFDELTMHRKGAEAALVALAERCDVNAHAVALATLVRACPRRASDKSPDEAVERLRALREALEVLLEESGSGGAECRHKEADTNASIEVLQESTEICDVAQIVEACPTLSDFGVKIRTVADVKHAGVRLRGAIQASRDAWEEVSRLCGELPAAVLVLYVLQCHADDVASGRCMIKSPGGLFRSLGRKLAVGNISLVAELQALRRRKRARLE